MPDDDRQPIGDETVASGVVPQGWQTTSVAVTLPAPPPAAALEAVAPAGARIGRFVVLGPLGHGGMGVVVSAFDPDLDRKVALKLVRSATWAELASWGRDRLLREARAMARLQHPNVLTVHEVGTVDDQAFIAMEFAAGGTLRAWCAARVRPWREVLAVLLAAGRGLVAAHQAGLVHRDFKPENVLLTGDGHVRVADFGLVGTVGDEVEAAAPLEPTSAGDPISRTGALIGTPAYMAPEQHQRQKAGPAADQFSFCVTAWESLLRVHPFAADRYRDFVVKVRAGVPDEPPDTDVPLWLRDVLRRGLRPDPAERWPSMEALLAALEHDPDAARRRRWRVIGFGAAFAALGAVAVVGIGRAVTPEAPRCRGMEQGLAGVWDDPTRAAVHTAFAALGRTYAEDTYRRVARDLDDHASAWTQARTDACEATHVRGEQSEAILDLRMACLDRRLAELRALTALFGKADGDILDNAVQAVGGLAPPSSCADVDTLRTIVPPPAAATRTRVDALRGRLAEAKVLEDAGKYREGLALATTLEAEARQVGYAPLLAEALFQRGSLEDRMSDAPRAQATLEEAALFAGDARDDALTAQIWTLLVYVLDARGRTDVALGLRPAAEAALRRSGNDARAAARFENAIGAVLSNQGTYDEAQKRFERALALREKALGPDHPLVATSASNLGKLLEKKAEYDAARRQYERALAIWTKALGPDHPEVADALSSVGLGLTQQGEYDEARRYQNRALAIREKALGPDHTSVAESLEALGSLAAARGDHADAQRLGERVLAIREKALGPDHPATASALNNLGNALDAQGKHEEARRHYERALAVWTKAFGPDHPDVATALTNLGVVSGELREYDQARRYHERALAVAEKTLGPAHPQLCGILANLGDVIREQGGAAEARRLHERALAIGEKALGPEDRMLAYALTGLADDLLVLGHAAEARPIAERAVRLRAARATSIDELAVSRSVLGRVMWTQGERKAAIPILDEARRGLEAAGPVAAKELADLDAWRRTHGVR